MTPIRVTRPRIPNAVHCARNSDYAPHTRVRRALRAASGKLARIDNLAGSDGDLRESIRYTVTKMLYDATGRLGDRLYDPPSTVELEQITKEWTA